MPPERLFPGRLPLPPLIDGCKSERVPVGRNPFGDTRKTVGIGDATGGASEFFLLWWRAPRPLRFGEAILRSATRFLADR